MPILDLQKGLRQLGKIRAGDQQPTANGKMRPAKLTQWRLTSPSYELLAAAAQLWGGDVDVWKGAPTEGEQYELYTNTDRLPVRVPPGDAALSQWYEMWNAGGCVRRCDGQMEQLGATACVCPPDHDERSVLAAKGKACKMTTRLNVLLPDIPDIGLWMLESHGYYAAVELAGADEILQLAAERKLMIPAQLRLEQRTVKRPKANGGGIETRHFIVPVLELVATTAGQLMAGQVTAIGPGGNGAAALPAPARPAINAPTRVASRTDAPESRAANGGPPMPPLPHEDPASLPHGAAGDGGTAGTASPAPASHPTDSPTRAVNRVAIAAREAGLDDDGRHDLAEYVSDSRVRSSALLDEAEAARAIAIAGRVRAGEVHLRRDDDGALNLLDGRFGWPAQEGDADPSAVGDDAGAPLTIEQARALKGPALTDALRAAQLELGGTEPVRQQRLIDALQAEPF